MRVVSVVYLVTLLALLGCLIGSMLTALVDRLHDKRKLVLARSECDSCQTTLGVWDLVPVISWLASRGKCRHCKDKISWRYPVIELVTTSAFIVSYIAWPNTLVSYELAVFAVWLVVLTGFIALSIYDIRWLILPNKILYPLIALAGLMIAGEAVWLADYGLLIGPLLGALCCGGGFYAMFQLSQGRWIGGGDVKLGILLGLLAGGLLSALLLMFLASVLGLLVALPQIFTNRFNLKSKLPFGPFLILSGVIVVLFGETILDWYLSVPIL